jgi:hypothetical protein
MAREGNAFKPALPALTHSVLSLFGTEGGDVNGDVLVAFHLCGSRQGMHDLARSNMIGGTAVNSFESQSRDVLKTCRGQCKKAIPPPGWPFVPACFAHQGWIF